MADEYMTYAQLKEQLDKLTPEQLTQPVVWSGDERGGYVKSVWIADEDWIGDSSDDESAMPRTHALQDYPEEYAEAEVVIPAGTVHLMVD
jgi:hypothetical protein